MHLLGGLRVKAVCRVKTLTNNSHTVHCMLDHQTILDTHTSMVYTHVCMCVQCVGEDMKRMKLFGCFSISSATIFMPSLSS